MDKAIRCHRWLANFLNVSIEHLIRKELNHYVIRIITNKVEYDASCKKVIFEAWNCIPKAGMVSHKFLRMIKNTFRALCR